MKGYRKKFGITLIALVVTIIVMLILAGVGINLIIGNNGLINRAEKAIFQHLTGEEIDILNMSHATLYINNKTFKEEYTTEKLQDEIIRMGKDVTVKRKKDDDNTMVITYKKTQNVHFIDIDKGEIIYRGHYIGEPVADFKENDIIFTQDNTEITNKNVNTTIQVRESINMTNYTLQWTKTPTVENSWQVYSLGQLITSEKNEVIFARIKNNVTEETELESSTTIKNIDKKKPVVEEIVSTTNKITFKATDTKDETNPYDKPSGIVGYKVSTDADSKDGFLFCDTTFELLETLKGYNQGTRYYVWVVDEACNISEIKSTLTGTVTQLNTANTQFISEPDGDTPTNDKVITKIHTTITEYKLQWTKHH